MIKKEFNRGYYKYVLEYDDEEYDIKYCSFSQSFVLMDKKGTILNTFPRTIGFIKQVNVNDKTYFAVSNKVVVDNLYKHDVLEMYEVVKSNPITLKVLDSSIIDTTDYDKIVLGSSSFLIKGDEKNERCIYSLDGDRLSRSYQSVVVDDRFKSTIGTNVLVEELIVGSKYRDLPDIYDVITYGVDPDTLKIVTRIYSKEQNRYIDLLSCDAIGKVRANSSDAIGLNYMHDTNDEVGSKTIYLEIIQPLEARIGFLGSEPKEINSYDEAIKSDFVKKIGINPKEN